MAGKNFVHNTFLLIDLDRVDQPIALSVTMVGSGIRERGAYPVQTMTQDALEAARRAFYALCTHIDHQLRLVIGMLREEGLLEQLYREGGSAMGCNDLGLLYWNGIGIAAARYVNPPLMLIGLLATSSFFTLI